MNTTILLIQKNKSILFINFIFSLLMAILITLYYKNFRQCTIDKPYILFYIILNFMVTFMVSIYIDTFQFIQILLIYAFNKILVDKTLDTLHKLYTIVTYKHILLTICILVVHFLSYS